MNVILVEDSVLLRAGIARLLTDAGMTVVVEANDAEMALDAVELHRPDIVVMDVRMPPTHTDEGIRAALTIRRRHPKISVLVLSQYVEQYYASELLAGDTAGVGYLLKDRVADVREFVAAVKHVASGGIALDADVVSELLARVRRGRPLESLTPRELEVMRLMAEGRSNTAIAAQLVVGEVAVEKHITSIFTKLDLAPADTDHHRVLAVTRSLRAPTFSETLTGDTLTVKSRCQSFVNGFCSVHYDLNVPAEVTVEATSSGGSLTASDAYDVDASSSAGSSNVTVDTSTSSAARFGCVVRPAV